MASLPPGGLQFSSEQQIVLFENHLKTSGYDNVMIKAVLDEHKKNIPQPTTQTPSQSANTISQPLNQQENTTWTLTMVEWSWLYCFGADNIIDFTKYNSDGTFIGIIADNKTGKSSIIDIICLGLFNETTRPTTNKLDFINNSAIARIT